MQKKLFVFVFLFLLTLFVGLFFLFTKKDVLFQNTSSTKLLQVSVSSYPIAHLVEKVAGSLVQVHAIIPSGIEPHDYEPSPSDISKIYTHDALVLNGAGFDPWGEKIQEDLWLKKIPVLVLLDELKHSAISENENRDPHMWLSPKLYSKQVVLMTDFLSSLDPKHRVDYEKNALAFQKELANLDSDFQNGLRNCQQDEIIVSHDAFAYLGSEYGITIHAITGISAEGEANPARLIDLVDLIKAKKINTVFFETLVSPKLAETLAQETGVQTAVLNPIEGLTVSDIQNNKNYDILMRENLSALKKALVCQ
jgi:zinc transport system substrate-binding protein